MTLIQIVILVLLLLLSGYFSSAETAMTIVNKVRIKALAEGGDDDDDPETAVSPKTAQRAEKVLHILDDFPKMLSTILIGNNIVNLSASSLTTVVATKLWGGYAIGIATGALTFLVILFGEIIPKTMASDKAEKMALSYAGSILFLMKVLTPLVFCIDKISGFFLRLLHVDKEPKAAMTERELKTYVDVSHEDGVTTTDEKKMIYNVFDFGDALAKEIMIPRIDMTCVSVDSTYEEVEKAFRQDMFTRLPVYEDNQDNMIGLLNIKDFLFVKDKEGFKVKNYLREAYYTYEYKKTPDLLMEMREQAKSVAYVLNEYGMTVGMITLEDLLEEIVGEIRDEYDSDEAEMIKDMGNGKYLIEGSVKLDDVNDALGLTDESSLFLDSEDYDSIGGLMIEHLDRLPMKREKITLENGVTLESRGVKHHRVLKVLLTLPEEEKTISIDDKV